MKFPAQAFGEAYPQKLSPGQIFKFRGYWSLRVAYGPGDKQQGFVILDGPNAGQLREIFDGMARSLTIIEPFSWFPAMDLDNPARPDALQTASLTVGPTGPVIVGGDMSEDRYDPSYLAFAIDGLEYEDYQPHGGLVRFDQWTAELALKARPFKSLGTLFSIDRRTKDTGG